MDINATLIGQMITFAGFVWFTMKFVWPILDQVLKERQQRIAEGLAAAERGHKELEEAQNYAKQHMQEARKKAIETVEQAKQQAILMIEEAKSQANIERDQIVALGHQEIESERRMAKEQLQNEIAELIMVGTQKLLGRVITEVDQRDLLNKGINLHIPKER